MPQINLKTAAGRIYQIVQQRLDRQLASPFFFIVGAGISSPQIPLARQIEDDCRAVAEKYGNTAPPRSSEASDSYSHWFSSAYPSADERQRYLRGLMEKKSISKANLRLAHLVLDGKIARTVFTPNFDDLLTKALELFGQRPLVCDHPLTVSRMRIDATDTQIIHVHGSYSFYDCCNLTQDIADRSGDAPMSVMLDQSLRDHSPLVIGYSGWESDILMSALKRRLQTGILANPLFWFCYRKESIESLPIWLRKNIRNEDRSDVYFVIPDDSATTDATPPPSSGAAAAISPTGGSQPSSNLGATSKSPGSKDTADTGLSAERVLDALVRRFNLSVPLLTENPLAFYVKQLRDLLGASDQGDAEPDTFYSFHTVIDRVERARDAESRKAPNSLQSFRDAMSKADYRAAITIAGTIDLATLPAEKLREIALVLWDASVRLLDNSAQEIEGYDLIVKSVDLLAAAGPVDLPLQLLVARALMYKSFTLNAINQHDVALVTSSDLLTRFANATDPSLLAQVARALLNQAYSLSMLNRNDEALKVQDALLDRFGASDDLNVQKQVANTLRNKGLTLELLGQNEEAFAVYDELVRRFVNSPELSIREEVAVALINKGFRLNVLKRSDEALLVFEEVLQHFADATEPSLQEQVATAYRNKSVALHWLDRSEEAVKIADDLIARFSDSAQPGIREQVACTIFNKGVFLSTLKRTEDAIATYDDLISHFSDSPEPAIQEQVAKALINKGLAQEQVQHNEAAIAAYNETLHRFATSPLAPIQAQVEKARTRLSQLENKPTEEVSQPTP